MRDNPLNSIKKGLAGYFSLSGYLVPQPQAEADIRENVTFKGTNSLILIFAILIASLGLNTNSTAVIIGAMLISPLMGPILGIGLGVGVRDFTLIRRSLRNLSIASLISVLASCLYFLISPVSEGHSELLARTSPTIYDVLIGFFGGFAGIIGLSSKSKGNVIPGVAIATALMPPLCTAGYGLATWQTHYLFGALYLFLINSIYIALATFIGVKLMKFKPVPVTDSKRPGRVLRIVYAVSILTLVPSIYLTYVMFRTERFEQNAAQFVSDEFKFPHTQVLSHSATMEHGERTINVTLIGKALPHDSLLLAMTRQMKYYGLEGTRLNILQGYNNGLQDDNTLRDPSVKDIYEIAQTSLRQKQGTIDSLTNIINAERRTDELASAMTPELKIFFPEIADIAISKAIFSDMATQQLDTVNIALVHFTQRLTPTNETKLNQYLCARLGVEHVRVIPVSL